MATTRSMRDFRLAAQARMWVEAASSCAGVGDGWASRLLVAA